MCLLVDKLSLALIQWFWFVTFSGVDGNELRCCFIVAVVLVEAMSTEAGRSVGSESLAVAEVSMFFCCRLRCGAGAVVALLRVLLETCTNPSLSTFGFSSVFSL